MYKLLLILIISTLTCTVSAEDIQWSKGYIGTCINPTQRVDGTPLDVSEILRVEYYLDKTDGNITNPELIVLMQGGCQDAFVDTKQVGTGDYFAYARTFTTDSLDSVASAPGVQNQIQKARPKSPSGLR
jgi:hypothetical protein